MRVLSGMQPSGQLHLGNYFGSMKPNLEWQNKAEQTFYFVADLHALTTVQDRDALRKSREDIVLDYLACGFDPKKSIIYYQSHIPEHTELMWILMTIMPMGLLERAVSYKDKVSKGLQPSVGLFTYPVLMAADILMYDANIVPVGKDQKQHVEFARDIAVKFNNTFGETLVIPEPEVAKEVAVVPGTDGQKMSKSYGNTIPLFGEEAAIKKSIMGIVTDSKGMNDAKDPEACIIYQIHKLFLNADQAKALADEYRNGLPYGDAKKKLFSTYMDYFMAMREKRVKITPAQAREVVESGAKRAKSVAIGTMAKVRAAVGLL
ncbi:tryptophan--tRNA ligase [Candidatus Peribacteria bacterium RIFCSPHIGHO2_01_FULL_55_13]|nr:MAG: tryptophan--tRNA ligase [Candidatus Peribacteria bacterium RIFCSPHIGHO2_01_FULL_55_13]OGJ66176.1 MAG: tryptophan--tRNA ligase [Candidatus Peribacteria bacterium RIFCSPHIGHO2_12_FULL_55_11]